MDLVGGYNLGFFVESHFDNPVECVSEPKFKVLTYGSVTYPKIRDFNLSPTLSKDSSHVKSSLANVFNPFYFSLNKPKKEVFCKHCGKRRKFLLPAFSPAPAYVFCSSLNKFQFVSHMYFVVCKLSQFR